MKNNPNIGWYAKSDFSSEVGAPFETLKVGDFLDTTKMPWGGEAGNPRPMRPRSASSIARYFKSGNRSENDIVWAELDHPNGVKIIQVGGAKLNSR